MMRAMPHASHILKFIGALTLACSGGEADSSGLDTSVPVTAGETGETGDTSVDPTTAGSATLDTQDPPPTDGGEETTAPVTTSETGTSTDGSTEPASGTTTDATTDTSTGGIAEFPAEVLDLTDWKLTLPIAGDDPDKPLEIFQPELATYTIDPYFLVFGDAVRFQAHAGGVTTSNSGYPRSELREMMNDGQDLADWSTTAGVHTMTITQAITHLPEVKQHVVAGQIHDDADDVVMIRLEGSYLFVEGGGADLGELDANYQLGQEFTVRLRAADGVIDVFYEDLVTPAVSVERDATGCYFKAGVYTQSNPDKGDEPTAYGEVVIAELLVTHE